MKEHVVYTYISHKINMINDSDVIRSLLNLLKLKRNECILLIRADALLFPDWIKFKRFFHHLPQTNYEIVTPQQKHIAYFVHNTQIVQNLKDVFNKRV